MLDYIFANVSNGEIENIFATIVPLVGITSIFGAISYYFYKENKNESKIENQKVVYTNNKGLTKKLNHGVLN